jgi:hypothetical protein
MAYQQYGIVSGHGGTPVNWETLTDADGYKFPPVAGLGAYEAGTLVLRGNGSITVDGLPNIKWRVQYLTYKQYKKIKTDYCGGGYSGLVTIKTKTDDDASYSDYNAVLQLPPTFKPDNEMGLIPELELVFVRLEAI